MNDSETPAVPAPPADTPLPPAPDGRAEPRLFGPGVVVAAALGGMVIGATVVALGLSLSTTSEGTDPASDAAGSLALAYEECGPMDGMELVDDDRTLSVDAEGETDFTGVSYTTVDCVLGALATPARVTELMNSTRALDGRQSDSWESITATWSYHPDSGLDLLLVEDREQGST